MFVVHPHTLRFQSFLSHKSCWNTTNPLKTKKSPLQTVDKDKTKRRVALDLSFTPVRSVNDGTPKDTFLDVPFYLILPRSADFVNLILFDSPGSFMCKKDVKRAHRQILVDPKDYKFLGNKWRDNYYFDHVLPFGLRSATMACQPTTTAIAYMFKSEFNFACINYVDDFARSSTVKFSFSIVNPTALLKVL